ncbi:AraC family transcriptional regulator [Aquimarina aquimarini]|uniref:AraC family transcriptional regulator n=1 Tax=Aquimarina aquimarini TaxID=1191734 RepID=UPI000D560D18|nr:GyrI-like domain-containing protein [Aquimarina aquimarini]
MQTKQNHYIRNTNKVLDYIDKNLEKSFSLEELSLIANFSKFHFRRIFIAIVGESPFQYIVRLRLEKSASLIISQPHKSLSEIAYQCGFSDLSIFSRSFKKHFNTTASFYKKEAIQKSNNSQTNSNIRHKEDKIAPYFCPASKTIKWTSTMEIIKNVEVRTLSKMTVAYNRSLGPYKGNNELYQKHRGELFAWAASKELMGNEDFKYLIVYHDNPKVTLNDTQRMSLCVTIPKETETDGIIGKMDIEEGKYVVCQFEMSAQDFPKAWDWIYGQWFPTNNYVPDDKPYFELYPEQPKGEIFKVEFYVPVKAI